MTAPLEHSHQNYTVRRIHLMEFQGNEVPNHPLPLLEIINMQNAKCEVRNMNCSLLHIATGSEFLPANEAALMDDN